MIRKPVFPLITAVLLSAVVLACSTTRPEDPQPGLQAECVKIADRSERERCLDEAAFGRSDLPNS